MGFVIVLNTRKLRQRGYLGKGIQLAVAGPEFHPGSLAPPPSSLQLSDGRQGRKGRFRADAFYPRNHFSSTNRRRNHEANETSTSFPGMLSPMSVPEEPHLGRLPNHSVWLSHVHAFVGGKSGSCEHTGGTEVPWNVTCYLERLKKGRRRG